MRSAIVLAFCLGSSAAALSADGPPAAPPNRVIAWNNLGMHCMDDDFAVFSLLPPFNTLVAQVVRNGQLVTDPTGLTVTYQAVADAAGSVNKTSFAKTNFWSFALDLYGAGLVPDQGLAGHDMPGLANTPQAMAWDAGLGAFQAEGIPITPYDDASQKNYYPLVRVTARNAADQVIATTDVVLPVSDELTCKACHASGSGAAAMPAAGWVDDPDPVLDYRLNVLRLHDEVQSANPAYATLLSGAGYAAGGLFATATGGKPVLCARCHLSNALPGSGVAGVKPLTEALHAKHAEVIDPENGFTLDSSDNRSACYRCHPGSVTKCLRGAMGSAVSADGTLAMQCQSCHGSMSQVGAPGREGWLDEPSCQQCHTGTAVDNAGKIRFTSVFDANGDPHVPANPSFATNADVPAAGFDLYRFSKGHGGLMCEACHGSTHAEFPSTHVNDNVQSLQLQGHKGTIAECSTCHGSLGASLEGPHGMHPVGQAWVSQHEEFAEEGGGAGKCKACHGATYKGSVLSRAFATRTLATEFGAKKLWRGFQVSCYLCHDGPGGEGASKNHPAAVQNAAAATDSATPVAIPLTATDADGDSLQLRVVDQPDHGTVALAGKLATYYPELGFGGSVAFTFAAWDGKVDSNLGTATVEVDDAACPALLSAAVATFAPAGGTGSVDVSIPAGCDWTAALSNALDTWVTIDSGAAGSGPGTVAFTVAANAGSVRSASLLVAGRTFAIQQAGVGSPNLEAAWKKLQATCKTKGGVTTCRVHGVLRVLNGGASKAKKSTVRFYVSDDGTFDPGDVLLKGKALKALGAGKFAKLTLDAVLPQGVSPAGRFVIAVLDAKQVVIELDETDNEVAGPLPPE